METTVFTDLLPALGTLVLRLIGALLVLVIGWLVAKWISGLVGKLLKRTNIDNKVANWSGGDDVPKVEDGIAKVIFYILMLFVLVAFFEVLGLTIITEPLNALLNTVFAYLPMLLAASVLIVVAWLVATILRGLTRRLLQAANVDKHLSDDLDPEKMSVSKALSEAVYWLIWLIFLPPILGALGLQSLVAPLTGMLDDILGFLPKLFAAIVILVVGWFVARILQRVVTGFLAALGADEFSDRIGLGKLLGKQNLSGLTGLIVFVMVLIPVVISALDAVGLDSLTQPLSNMLDSIFTAIPAILAAFVVLVVAYVVARLVADLVANVLEGIGFDNIMVTLGLSKETTTGKSSPSNIVGYLVLVAIMLLAVMSATSLLNIPSLSIIVAQFIAFTWRIVIGLVIFGLGLWLATMLGKFVEESDWPKKNLVSMFARIAVIALATAMALSQMGLADSIINMAFGLILGAIAFAIALAFGLGGREVAGKELETWVNDLHAEDVPQIETAAEAE